MARSVQYAPTFHRLAAIPHASALIADGMDVAEVSARLGHAEVETTSRAYVHQFDAARRSVQRAAARADRAPLRHGVCRRKRS